MSHSPRCEWPLCHRIPEPGSTRCSHHLNAETVLEETFVGIDPVTVLRIAVLQGVSGAVRIDLMPVVPIATPKDDSWKCAGPPLSLPPLVVGAVAQALTKPADRWGGRA